MTRRELAHRAGVTEKTLYAYEREGIEHARLGCMARLAAALGVSVNDLFEVDGEGVRP